MMLVVFEAHATTLDNEAGLASGWNDVALSKTGERQAVELGERYKLEDLDAVYVADLQRCYSTAHLAFPSITSQKLRIDWRLREANYGKMTQRPKGEVEKDKINRVDVPFVDGESYRSIIEGRMSSFVDDLKNTGFKQVLVIGSRATHWGLDVLINGERIEDCVVKKLVWQPGWQYELARE